jgi:hypothetical protein
MQAYMASQKDVPDFNNLLLEFNITQRNRISIDGKEKSPNFFRHMWNVPSTTNQLFRETVLFHWPKMISTRRTSQYKSLFFRA